MLKKDNLMDYDEFTALFTSKTVNILHIVLFQAESSTCISDAFSKICFKWIRLIFFLCKSENLRSDSKVTLVCCLLPYCSFHHLVLYQTWALLRGASEPFIYSCSLKTTIALYTYKIFQVNVCRCWQNCTQ